MILQIIIMLTTLVALYIGAEMILDSAEIIGSCLKLSPLVIGILLIGLGTSLPELFISHIACLDGNPPIALGNIIGSNIANIFLIMGITGSLTTIKVAKVEVKRQILQHSVLMTILCLIIFWGKINITTLVVLLGFFVVYLYNTIKYPPQTIEEDHHNAFNFTVPLKFIIGLALLFFGGKYLISSTAYVSLEIGLDEYIISAVVIALGTSLPELVTAIIACKKQKDTHLIIGNVIGSNIFNTSFILGGLGIYNITIHSKFYMEMIALFSVSLMLVILSKMGKDFGKGGGVLFLLSYIAIVYGWL